MISFRRTSSPQAMVNLHPVLAHDGEKPVVLPASEAWPRLQALHLHAALESSKGDFAAKPDKKSARAIYAQSLGSAHGQFATAHPALRNSMFHSLVNHVAQAGSMDGLESLYAAGLEHTSKQGGTLHDDAMQTMQAVGRGLPLTYKVPFDPRRFSQGTVAQLGGQLVAGLGTGDLKPVGGVPGLPSGGSTPEVPDVPGMTSIGDLVDQVNQKFGTNIPTPGDQFGYGSGAGIIRPDGPLSDNPGQAGYVLKLKGNPNQATGGEHGLGAAIGRAGGPLSENPGGKKLDFNDHNELPETGMQKEIDRLKAKAADQRSPLNPARRFGPDATGHIVNPKGPEGGGDPGADNDNDAQKKSTGTQEATTGGILGGIVGALTAPFARDAAVKEAATSQVSYATAENLTATEALEADFTMTATVGAEAEGAPVIVTTGALALGTVAAIANVVGMGGVGAGLGYLMRSGGGRFVGDDGTGGGGGGSGPVGPRTSGYMPSEEGGSPANPHSFSMNEKSPVANLEEVMPAPDDTGRGGPRSRAARSFDALPDPESNQPGTPHSFGSRQG